MAGAPIDVVTGLVGMTSSNIAGYNKLSGANGTLSDNEASNLIAQTMSGAFGAFSTLPGVGKNTGAMVATAAYSTTAFLTGYNVYVDDRNQFNKDLTAHSANAILEADENKILGDYVAMAGDVLNFTGAIIQRFGGAESKYGIGLTGAGVALTAMGIALDTNVNFAAFSAAVQSKINNYLSGAEAILNTITSNSSDFQGITWGSTGTDLEAALQSIAGVTQTANPTTFGPLTNSVSTFLGTSSSDDVNLFNSSGLTASNFTATATGNDVAVTGGTSTPNIVGDVILGPSLTGISYSGSTSGFSETDAIGNNGSLIDTVESSGSTGTPTFTQTTTTATSGAMSATISGTGDECILTNTSITFATNAQATIDGSGDQLKLAAGANITTDGADTIIDLLGSHSFSDTLANTQVVVDVLGNATFTSPQTGFGNDSIIYNVSGAGVFKLGSDALTFSSNTLNGVSFSNGGFNFGLASTVSGDSEGLVWNPTTGKALFDLTSSGGTVAESLGYINPGDTLKDTGSTFGLYNSSSQEIDGIQVNANGSQVDTSYDLSGGTWKDDVIDYTSTGATSETQLFNNDGSSAASFYNPAQKDALEDNESIASNGSGTISTLNSQTISFAAGDTPTISYNAAGDTIIFLATNAGKGPADVYDLNSSGITVTDGGVKIPDFLGSNSIAVDAAGDITFNSSVTGFGADTLTAGANGTDTFVLGKDELSFAGNSLQTESYSSGAFDFGLKSSATGDSEGIVWNPTTGKALLDITTASGTVAESLGYINPGDIVAVNGSTITNDNASGQVMYSALVNSNGSQVDTSYDLSGGTWKDDVIDYNNSGAITETQVVNNDGSSSASFYNPAQKDAIEDNDFLNANGTGTFTTLNNQTISFAAGDNPTVSFSAAGDTLVSFATNAGKGPTDTYDLSSSGITATDAANKVADFLGSSNVAVDSLGNMTFTAPLTGFGTDSLTVSTTGVDTFAVGKDDLSFSGDSLQSISYSAGAFDYTVASSAKGESEGIVWNPTTGKALLDLTTSTGTVVESLGYINPGDDIGVSGSLITNDNSTGQVMNSILVNTDGSQLDTSYDLSGGTWKDDVYSYNSAGALTEVQYVNNDTSSVIDYYNPSQNDAQVTQEITNANGSGSVAWGTNGNNGTLTFTKNSGTLQLNVSGIQDFVNAIGSGTITSSSDVTADVASNSQITFNTSNSTIVASAGDTIISDGGGNTITAPSGAKITADVTGANDTIDNVVLTPGSLAQTDTISSNGSIVVDPNTGSSSISEFVSDYNTSGKLLSNIQDNTNGSSQEQLYSGLSSGISEEVENFTGTNATGTLNSTINDYTAGGSQEQLFTGLPSGTSETIENYSGTNATGTLNNETSNFTAGGSQEIVYTGNAAGVTLETDDFAGANDTGTQIDAKLNLTDGTSQDQIFTGLPSGDSLEVMYYAGANDTGALTDSLYNYTSGGSQIDAYDPSSGVAEEVFNTADANGTGELNSAALDFSSGNDVDMDFSYDSSGDLTNYTESFYDDGSFLGTTDYNSAGDYTGGDSDFEDDGDYGEEFEDSGAPDYASLNNNAANPAASVQYKSAFIAAGGSTKVAVLQNATWGSQKTITWSFASSNISNQGSALFSGYITNGSQQAAIIAALSQWAKASGLTFKEVADSSQTDIRFGFGDFNTQSTGVIGYTTSSDDNGVINNGAVIRLEDPNQLSLAAGTNGQLSYGQTDATFEQVILHEIGHALGFADNIDPNSVMYYQATASNQTLDKTDIAGAQAVYANGSSAALAPVTGTASLLNGTTVHDFAVLDKIDITDISFGAKTTLSFTEDKSGSFGTLTVSDGIHTAAIQLLGQYIAAGFGKTSDASAGTSITYVPPVNHTAVLAASH
jgi:predicted Zn-dependent protease